MLLLLDPFGQGWNVPGSAHRDVAQVLSAHPTLVAVEKVAFVSSATSSECWPPTTVRCGYFPRRHRLSGQPGLLMTVVLCRSEICTSFSAGD
ncbi:MAG: hypothetical protein PHQ28_12095 [Mycobacterium sp.]|nr:hypothetical protein [Mycobacterium sp.]